MRFIDNAEPILRSQAELSDDTRAELWQHFHSAKDASTLSANLEPLHLHPDFKAELIAAKRKPSVEYDAVEKIVNSVNQIGRMAPHTLDWAEKNPDAFKAMLAGSNL